MAKMRAKMSVHRIEHHGNEGGDPHDIVGLSAVYGGDEDESENWVFGEMTPAGQIELVVANPRLVGSFHEGQTFYVDFTEADSA